MTHFASKLMMSRVALLVATAAIGTLLQSPFALAQEIIQPAPVSPLRVPELGQVGATVVPSAPAPSVSEWKEITPEASGSDVSKILDLAGWTKELAGSKAGGFSTDGQYSVYTRNVAAGVSDFLVVPRSNGSAQPIEFKSAGIKGWTQNAAWGVPTAEEMRNEILEGMQAAIDSLCGMKARPTEITVKASAAGIVEVEAKWLTSEVCVPQ